MVKIFKIIGINGLILLCLLLLAEAIGFIGLKNQTKITKKNTSPRSQNNLLGFWNAQETEVLASKYCGMKACFEDILYKFDEFGRRIGNSPKPLGRPIVVLGDSFTFGYGLPYQETLSALLEQKLHRPVINYGINGGDPNQIYTLVRRRVLSQQLPIESDFIIILTRAILNRGMPTLRQIDSYLFPHYIPQEQGAPLFYQNGRKAYPQVIENLLTLKKIKSYSHFLQWIDFDYSPFSEEELALNSIQLIEQTALLLKKIFKGQVWIVEHPHGNYYPFQKEILIKRNTPLNFMTFPSDISKNRDLCFCDSHPNSLANRAFAQMLIESLNLGRSD